MRTLLVVDDQRQADLLEDRDCITFEHYLQGDESLRSPGLRIINLCDTTHYLSRGYYCSLLAEARRQKVMPDVATINALREASDGPGVPLPEELPGEVAPETSSRGSQLVFFGWTESDASRALATALFKRYPAPILRFSVRDTRSGPRIKLSRASFSRLDKKQREQCLEQLDRVARADWKPSPKLHSARWDMAILVDPEEKYPPSNSRALKRFLRAAARHGIKADLVTAATIGQLNFYDALFIRETTAIDHHTYRLARRAEELGLVVIDDPRSILRCCNKVYLHDAFDSEAVPTLKTRAIQDAGDATLDMLEREFDYPMVVKLPESSFSRGVFRLETREDLAAKLTEVLAETALVLVQEYFYTEFDWRIGVLDRRALYACRYDMVRGHWQIYNHARKRGTSGDSVTLPTFEVPRGVVDAATRACRAVGDGLYGVDVKQRGSRVAVVEVNDNPSIDAGVEDEYLGRELYDQVMTVFASRLERRGR